MSWRSERGKPQPHVCHGQPSTGHPRCFIALAERGRVWYRYHRRPPASINQTTRCVWLRRARSNPAVRAYSRWSSSVTMVEGAGDPDQSRSQAKGAGAIPEQPSTSWRACSAPRRTFRRIGSRVTAAVDLLAALPLISAAALAAGIGPHGQDGEPTDRRPRERRRHPRGLAPRKAVAVRDQGPARRLGRGA